MPAVPVFCRVYFFNLGLVKYILICSPSVAIDCRRLLFEEGVGCWKRQLVSWVCCHTCSREMCTLVSTPFVACLRHMFGGGNGKIMIE